MEKSVFEEIAPPEKYGWTGFLSIAGVAIVLLIVLLSGMTSLIVCITEGYYSVFEKAFQAIISMYLILACVLGIIIRGKYGWTLSLSCCYVVISFGVAAFLRRNFVSGASSLVIATIPILLLHSYPLRRFYHVPQELALPHFKAVALALLVAILASFAFNWRPINQEPPPERTIIRLR